MSYIKSYLVPVVSNTTNELPKYETTGASGMDLRADLKLVNTNFLFSCDYKNNSLILYPGGRVLVPTGLRIALPEGYEAQVRPRSGLALKKGITVLNTPGTIDADYRGEIGVILMNLGRDPFVINQGDRIAQMVLTKVDKIEWRQVESLDETIRGEGGFNSTGVK